LIWRLALTKRDEALIAKAKAAVSQRFPEMSGVKPTVSVNEVPGRAGPESSLIYVVTFQKDVLLEGGVRLKRVVRVSINQAGDIVKLSASR
jgi:hypothetical protein